MEVRTYVVKTFLHVIIILLGCLSFNPGTAHSETGTWETLTCIGAPTGRHENGFVECGGKFYLFGGRGIKPVEVFDPETVTWEKLRPTPLEMHHFQAITNGESIYVVGCMTGQYPSERPLPAIHIYHPETDTWAVGPEIPENRRRGSSGAVLKKRKNLSCSRYTVWAYKWHCCMV